MTDLRMRLGALIVVAFAGLAGCGLISSDVTNFNLDLPDKKFSIDTMSWNVDQQMATAVLNTMCTASSQCMAAAEAACAMDCSGTCNASSRCTINLDVGLHTSVNLLMEKPELQQINDKSVIEVEIDDVLYLVEQNTLNVPTPEISVYVAPMSVMDPKDPLAKKIGTIPPVTAGMTTPAAQKMMFTADGRTNLTTAMGNFKTPFNVIVGSTLTMTAGMPVPAGRLDAIIRIRAHAGI
jgi:hypothetical protein